MKKEDVKRVEGGQRPKVNIIELGNLKIVSETDGLEQVAQIFSKMVKINKKIISPIKDIPPMEMYG